MKLYRIWNRKTGEDGQAEAESAQEACKKLGWRIGDCQTIGISECEAEEPEGE